MATADIESGRRFLGRRRWVDLLSSRKNISNYIIQLALKPPLQKQSHESNNTMTIRSEATLLQLLNWRAPRQTLPRLVMPRRLASVRLPASQKPIRYDNEDHDTVDSGDVVHIFVHQLSARTASEIDNDKRTERTETGATEKKKGSKKWGHSLPGPTGIAGGKEYMPSVKQVHSSKTTFATSPNRPSQKGPWRKLPRP